MVLNIVKNKLSASDVADYVKKVFDSSEVEIQKEYCICRYLSDRKECST